MPAYEALPLADPEIGPLIHAALSRLIGQARGSRTFVRHVCVALAGIGRLDYRRADGSVEGAIAPHLPINGWSAGNAVINRLGLTPQELNRMWDVAQARDGIHAVLPLETVVAFFPTEVWPLIEAVLEWGPAEACDRLERFARLEALRPIKPTRARPDGGSLSAGSVDNLLTGARRLLNVLCDLNARGYPTEFLERWTVLPAAVSAAEIGALEATTDRSAPPLLLVRRTLRQLDAEVSRRRGTWRAKWMLRPLRKRLLLALLATTGARIGAIAALRVCDYEPTHRFPSGDVGPAVRLFPGKSLVPTDARWKALPDTVALWLEEYTQYVGIADEPESTLWPSDLKPGEAMLSTSLTTILAGDPSSRPPHLPLLPREPGSSYGYSAHTLRHLAEQCAYEAGHDYLIENPDAKGFITPQVFADALLDHAMRSDHLGYKDLASRDGRERWARFAAIGVWDYIWGDKGARRVPDQERIARAKDAWDELRAELNAVQTRIADLRGRRRELEKEGENATEASTDDLVRMLFQLSALAGGLEEEYEESERVQQRLHAAEQELRLARTTLVPLDDLAPDPDLETPPEEEPNMPHAVDEPVRDWLTPREAARAFNVSEPTMRRWLRGVMPHPEGDPRNPWQPSEASLVVERHGPRKQRIVVSQLDRSRIAPEVMHAIKEFLAHEPR